MEDVRYDIDGKRIYQYDVVVIARFRKARDQGERVVLRLEPNERVFLNCGLSLKACDVRFVREG